MTPFEEQVAARRAMVRQTHPILSRMREEPAPSLIPIEQALAMELEARDDLRARLAICEANIKVLRDCAQ